MAFALSAAQTIAGIANSYECTGSGNLDDLATVFSTVGCTRTGNTLVFDSGGTSRIYAISGTLSDQRGGDYHVIVQNGAHVCWSYAAAASVTLGQYDATFGLPLSSVNINYRQNALATGYDQFQTTSLVGKCALGLGIFNQDAGTFLYDQSSRADLDIPNTKTTATTFNAVLLATGANQTITHTHTSASFVTTARTRFKAPGAFEVDATKLTTVQPLSTTVGARILNIQTGTVRLLQQTASQLDTYLVGSAAVIQSVDPTSLYHAPQSTSFLGGIKQIMRTFKATSKTTLGVDIASSKLLVTPLTSGTTETITTFTSSATAEVLQSAVANGVNYSSAGVGYTDTSSYKVSVLGFGYPSTPTTYDVKTNAGTAGIAVSAVLSKSSYVTSPYASVVTAPFSFSTTANGTLTIGSSATISQAAEYLFKIAYDNASAAFWVGLSHNPVVTTSGLADFGLISLSVGSGVALTGVAFKCATVTTAVALNNLTLTANVAQATPTNLTGLVLTGNLTFNTNSNITITLTGCTVTGTISNTGTGTVTITNSGSTLGTIGTNVVTRLYALGTFTVPLGSSIYLADNTGTQKDYVFSSGTTYTYDATGGTGTWTIKVTKYGYNAQTFSFAPTAGVTSNTFTLLADLYITQTSATTVATYTTLMSTDQLYDYASYYETTNVGIPLARIVGKQAAQASIGSYNLVNSLQASVFSFSSSTLTINAIDLANGTSFTGGVVTTGTVTNGIGGNINTLSAATVTNNGTINGSVTVSTLLTSPVSTVKTVNLTGAAVWSSDYPAVAYGGSIPTGTTLKVTSAQVGLSALFGGSVLQSGGVLANYTLLGGDTTAYDLTVFDGRNLTFSAGSTFQNTSGQNIVLMLAAGQTQPTLLATSGTITIQIYAVLTLTGLTAGSSLGIYDGSGTLIEYVASSGTSYTREVTGNSGTWTAKIRLYAYQDQAFTFTPATGSFTGAAGYIPDTYVVDTLGNVTAYTDLATVQKVYDYSRYFATTQMGMALSAQFSKGFGTLTANEPYTLNPSASSLMAVSSGVVTTKTSGFAETVTLVVSGNFTQGAATLSNDVQIRASNLDSELTFSGIDSITIYANQSDALANTNAGATSSTGIIRFKYGASLSGVTMSGTVYARYIFGGAVQVQSIPLVAGANAISLSTTTLLQSVLNGLTDIKGTGFVKDANSLTNISSSVSSMAADALTLPEFIALQNP